MVPIATGTTAILVLAAGCALNAARAAPWVVAHRLLLLFAAGGKRGSRAEEGASAEWICAPGFHSGWQLRGISCHFVNLAHLFIEIAFLA
jgi:hypothetical protein